MKLPTKGRAASFLDAAAFISLCLVIVFAGFSNSGVEIFVFISLAAILLKAALEGAWRGLIPSTGLNGPILLLLSAAAISIIFSIDPLKSLRAFFGKTVEYALIYFMIVASVNSKKRLAMIISTLLLSGLLLCVSGAWQWMTGFDFLRHRPLNYTTLTHIPRLTSAFVTRAGFAAYLTLVLPICAGVAIFVKTGRLHRAAMLALTAAFTCCFVLTYSRGAWIGVFMAGCMMVWYRYCSKLSLSRKVIAILLLVLIVIGAVPLLPSYLQGRLFSIERLDPERFAIWRATLNMIKDRPLFGHGVGRFIDAYQDYWISGKHKIYAHNGYLHTAAEIGLVGLGAFIWMLAAAFRSGVRAASQSPYLPGLLCGLTAFLTHSLFDNNLFSLQLVVLFWAVLGLATAAVKTTRS